MDEYVKVLPICHLNGTARSALVEQRMNFLNGLYVAQKALAEMSPNGRDYYPVPGLLEKAVKAQERRTRILKMLYQEVETEVLDLETEAA